MFFKSNIEYDNLKKEFDLLEQKNIERLKKSHNSHYFLNRTFKKQEERVCHTIKRFTDFKNK